MEAGLVFKRVLMAYLRIVPMNDNNGLLTSPFTMAFRYPARVAIVGVLVDARDDPLGATDVARQAGIAQSTFHDHRDDLRDLGLLERHDDGAYPTYSLAETDCARALVALVDELETAYSTMEEAHEESVEEFLQ